MKLVAERVLGIFPLIPNAAASKLSKFCRLAVEVKGKLSTLASTTFETAAHVNLELLRIFSNCTGAPFAVTDEAVFVDVAPQKRLLWTLSLGALLTRVIFIGGGLILSLTVDRYWDATIFPFNATVFMGASLGFICGYVGLTRQQHNFATTWTLILKYKTQVKSPKEMIWLLSVFFPFVNGFPVALSLFLALKPQMVIQFRFAVTWALEQGFLTPGPTYWVLVTITTVADFWTANLVMINILTVLQFHMLFLETWSSIMNQLIDGSIQEIPFFGLNHVCRTIDEFLVALRIFNVSSATIVFATKIFCLFCGITSQSSLILLDFSDNLLFLGVMAYLSSTGPFMYPAFYHRAPAVSAGLQRVKLELLTVRQFTMQDASFGRRLRAISPKGIWVGSFRTYERESDLVYMDFIANQVASLVLM